MAKFVLIRFDLSDDAVKIMTAAALKKALGCKQALMVGTSMSSHKAEAALQRALNKGNFSLLGNAEVSRIGYFLSRKAEDIWVTGHSYMNDVAYMVSDDCVGENLTMLALKLVDAEILCACTLDTGKFEKMSLLHMKHNLMTRLDMDVVNAIASAKSYVGVKYTPGEKALFDRMIAHYKQDVEELAGHCDALMNEFKAMVSNGWD